VTAGSCSPMKKANRPCRRSSLADRDLRTPGRRSCDSTDARSASALPGNVVAHSLDPCLRLTSSDPWGS